VTYAWPTRVLQWIQIIVLVWFVIWLAYAAGADRLSWLEAFPFGLLASLMLFRAYRESRVSLRTTNSEVEIRNSDGSRLRIPRGSVTGASVAERGRFQLVLTLELSSGVDVAVDAVSATRWPTKVGQARLREIRDWMQAWIQQP
jgi:hypothetical protein